jgi:hypothetical protein
MFTVISWVVISGFQVAKVLSYPELYCEHFRGCHVAISAKTYKIEKFIIVFIYVCSCFRGLSWFTCSPRTNLSYRCLSWSSKYQTINFLFQASRPLWFVLTGADANGNYNYNIFLYILFHSMHMRFELTIHDWDQIR